MILHLALHLPEEWAYPLSFRLTCIKGSLLLKFTEHICGLWPFRFPFLDFFFITAISYPFIG